MKKLIVAFVLIFIVGAAGALPLLGGLFYIAGPTFTLVDAFALSVGVHGAALFYNWVSSDTDLSSSSSVPSPANSIDIKLVDSAPRENPDSSKWDDAPSGQIDPLAKNLTPALSGVDPVYYGDKTFEYVPPQPWVMPAHCVSMGHTTPPGCLPPVGAVGVKDPGAVWSDDGNVVIAYADDVHDQPMVVSYTSATGVVYPAAGYTGNHRIGEPMFGMSSNPAASCANFPSTCLASIQMASVTHHSFSVPEVHTPNTVPFPGGVNTFIDTDKSVVWTRTIELNTYQGVENNTGDRPPNIVIPKVSSAGLLASVKAIGGTVEVVRHKVVSVCPSGFKLGYVPIAC